MAAPAAEAGHSPEAEARASRAALDGDRRRGLPPRRDGGLLDPLRVGGPPTTAGSPSVVGGDRRARRPDRHLPPRRRAQDRAPRPGRPRGGEGADRLGGPPLL